MKTFLEFFSLSGTSRTNMCASNQMWHSFQRSYDNFFCTLSQTNRKKRDLQRKPFSLHFLELSRSVSFNLNFNKTQPHSLCKFSRDISCCAFDNHTVVLEAGVKSSKAFVKVFFSARLRKSQTLPVSKALNHSRKRRTWFPTCSASENFLRLSANYETVRQKFSFSFRFAEKFILAEWK